jgi:hypothetical protein
MGRLRIGIWQQRALSDSRRNIYEKKKYRAAILAGLILVLLLPSASIAAVKPGAKCQKQNAKLISKGKIFTCIKLGKSLSWDKGVKYKLLTPTPTATPTATQSSITVSQANAIKRVKSYLRTSSFSRARLIQQLEYEGFSNADATYGVDSENIDWRNQAVLRAKSYLQTSSFSRTRLIKQLTFEGFSDSDSVYGVDAQNTNWNEQAALRAKSYLQASAFSRDGLLRQLLFEGFTAEQATYGVGTTGL